jgi:hypothetical protein
MRHADDRLRPEAALTFAIVTRLPTLPVSEAPRKFTYPKTTATAAARSFCGERKPQAGSATPKIGQKVLEIRAEAEGIEAASNSMGKPAHPSREEAVPFRQPLLDPQIAAPGIVIA